MIPYVYIPIINLGPITIQVWGLMVSLGILTSLLIAKNILARRGIQDDNLVSLAVWIILAAFLGARLAHALFYEPRTFTADPLEFFRVWHGGFSSFGGFVGGAIAGILYIRKNKLPQLAYVDAILVALPWGWAIGRVGCFLIHDHPGTLTGGILGVRYPGGARFDLGFIEILNGLSAGLVILIARRFFKKDAVAPAFGVVWYAVARFFTEFLRASDVPASDARYLGLTPAQYGSAVLAALAVYFIIKHTRKAYET